MNFFKTIFKFVKNDDDIKKALNQSKTFKHVANDINTNDKKFNTNVMQNTLGSNLSDIRKTETLRPMLVRKKTGSRQLINDMPIDLDILNQKDDVNQEKVNPNMKTVSKDLKNIIKSTILKIQEKENYFTSTISGGDKQREDGEMTEKINISKKRTFSQIRKISSHKDEMSDYSNTFNEILPRNSYNSTQKLQRVNESPENLNFRKKSRDVSEYSNSNIEKEFIISPMKKSTNNIKKVNFGSEPIDNISYFETKKLSSELEEVKKRDLNDSLNSYFEEGKTIKNVFNINVSSPDINYRKLKKVRKEVQENAKITCNDDINYDNRKFKVHKNVYDSDEMSEEELMSDEDKSWVIRDDSKPKMIWDLLMIVVILYSVTIDPYISAFSTKFNSQLTTETLLQIIIDFLFLCELILNFFTPFYKNDVLVENQRKIMLNYLKSWFILDFISAFPSSLILYLSEFKTSEGGEQSKHNIVLTKSIFRLTRLYRLIRWFKVFRIFKLFQYGGKFPVDFQLNKNSGINRMFKFSFIFLILSHISSCIWIYIAKLEGVHDSWIYVFNLEDAENVDVYIASYYYNLVTIYTIGYGDITAKTLTERIYNIFFMLIGVMLFSFAISSLSTIFIELDYKSVKLNKKVEILNDIHKDHLLSKQLYDKVKKVLIFQNNRVKLENYELLESLPYSLKKQIIFSMTRTGINNFYFFKKQSRDFVINVIPLMKSMKISQNETLISVGDYIEEMYIINRGSLSIKLEDFFKNLEISSIKSNSHFGDILMYINENSPYLVQCKSISCDLFTIQKKDFLNIKQHFNENVLTIFKRSVQILENIELRKKFMIDMYNNGLTLKEIKITMKKFDNIIQKCNFYNLLDRELNYEEARDFILSHDLSDIIAFFTSSMKEFDFKRCFNKHNLKYCKQMTKGSILYSSSGSSSSSEELSERDSSKYNDSSYSTADPYQSQKNFGNALSIITENNDTEIEKATFLDKGDMKLNAGEISTQTKLIRESSLNNMGNFVTRNNSLNVIIPNNNTNNHRLSLFMSNHNFSTKEGRKSKELFHQHHASGQTNTGNSLHSENNVSINSNSLFIEKFNANNNLLGVDVNRDRELHRKSKQRRQSQIIVINPIKLKEVEKELDIHNQMKNLLLKKTESNNSKTLSKHSSDQRSNKPNPPGGKKHYSVFVSNYTKKLTKDNENVPTKGLNVTNKFKTLNSMKTKTSRNIYSNNYDYGDENSTLKEYYNKAYNKNYQRGTTLLTAEKLSPQGTKSFNYHISSKNINHQINTCSFKNIIIDSQVESFEISHFNKNHLELEIVNESQFHIIQTEKTKPLVNQFRKVSFQINNQTMNEMKKQNERFQSMQTISEKQMPFGRKHSTSFSPLKRTNKADDLLKEADHSYYKKLMNSNMTKQLNFTMIEPKNEFNIVNNFITNPVKKLKQSKSIRRSAEVKAEIDNYTKNASKGLRKLESIFEGIKSIK
jgi:hypothetical protein